jgi:hypothetical protein
VVYALLDAWTVARLEARTCWRALRGWPLGILVGCLLAARAQEPEILTRVGAPIYWPFAEVALACWWWTLPWIALLFARHPVGPWMVQTSVTPTLTLFSRALGVWSYGAAISIGAVIAAHLIDRAFGSARKPADLGWAIRVLILSPPVALWSLAIASLVASRTTAICIWWIAVGTSLVFGVPIPTGVLTAGDAATEKSTGVHLLALVLSSIASILLVAALRRRSRPPPESCESAFSATSTATSKR